MTTATAARSRYQGPPGDLTEYWLPRDRDALDRAWDRYYAEHPGRDTIHPGLHPDLAPTDRDGEPVF